MIGSADAAVFDFASGLQHLGRRNAFPYKLESAVRAGFDAEGEQYAAAFTQQFEKRGRIMRGVIDAATRGPFDADLLVDERACNRLDPRALDEEVVLAKRNAVDAETFDRRLDACDARAGLDAAPAASVDRFDVAEPAMVRATAARADLEIPLDAEIGPRRDVALDLDEVDACVATIDTDVLERVYSG